MFLRNINAIYQFPDAALATEEIWTYTNRWQAISLILAIMCIGSKVLLQSLNYMYAFFQYLQ